MEVVQHSHRDAKVTGEKINIFIFSLIACFCLFFCWVPFVRVISHFIFETEVRHSRYAGPSEVRSAEVIIAVISVMVG